MIIHGYNRNSRDFKKLRSSAHFLGGSSAALGLVRVQAGCETLQQHSNTDISNEMDGETVEHSLGRCSEALELLKADYVEVQVRLRTILQYLMQRDAVMFSRNQDRTSSH